MTSPCVLEGILQLSAVFSGRPIETVERRGVAALHLQAMSNPIYDLRVMVSFLLVRTLLFVRAVPDTWEASFHGREPSLDYSKFRLVDATQRRIWSSSLALFSRLGRCPPPQCILIIFIVYELNETSPSKEIAYHLLKQATPVTISDLIDQIPSPSKTYEASFDQSQKILDSCLRCLRLLYDVMNLCLPVLQAGDDNDAAPPRATASTLVGGASRVARWKQLLGKLWTWQADRPPELQPLVEVEGREATFPTVTFPSGAGISSNTLYHTAMLLLLDNQPQSISPLTKWDGKPELDAAAQFPPLWHARRVCGIALNSDPEHTRCWDPCMIAAFWVAARRMTHPSQQNDILACLDRVKRADWHIDGLVQRLRDEWGPIG